MDNKDFEKLIYSDPSAAEAEMDAATREAHRELLDDVHALDATLKSAMQLDVPPLQLPELAEIDDSDASDVEVLIYSDPLAVEAEMDAATRLRHRDLLTDVRALDATLKSAMEIDVPPLKLPELPEIEDSNVTPLFSRKRAPLWLATAAAVAMLAVLFGRLELHEHGDLSLGEQIIAHMDHEPYSRVVTDRAVDERRLARVVPASIADFPPERALITYAQSCEINGRQVPHLVIQGERGPVTIMLLPDEKLDGPSSIGGNKFYGVLVPVGDGAIAILSEDESEDLEAIERSVVDSVTWQT